MSEPPSGPRSPQEERGGAGLQGEQIRVGDVVSVNLLESRPDDGDVILVPTREDVRSAFNAVAGGPPILFGTSAGAAWRAASAMLPELKVESRHSKPGLGWLGASAALLLTGIFLVGLFFLNVSLGVTGTAVAVALLIVFQTIRLSFLQHQMRTVVLKAGQMRVEIKADSAIERIPKEAGSSKDAETAQTASPDKE